MNSYKVEKAFICWVYYIMSYVLRPPTSAFFTVLFYKHLKLYYVIYTHFCAIENADGRTLETRSFVGKVDNAMSESTIKRRELCTEVELKQYQETILLIDCFEFYSVTVTTATTTILVLPYK